MIWKGALLWKSLRKKPSGGKKNETCIPVDKGTDIIGWIPQEPGVQSKRKGEDFNSIEVNAGFLRKRSRKDLKTMDQKADSVDLTSQLPEHIIHHILSLLRCKKDAVRTSTLSKRWRNIWTSFSVLEFDQRKFQKHERELDGASKGQIQEIVKNKEMFRDFIDNTLQSRIKQNVSIQKFVLHMISYDLNLATHMDRWIGVATGSNIQELDLHFPDKKNNRYSLPQIVFTAETITALRIYGCKLGTCSDIKLSHLRKLCLGKLYVDEQIIQNMIVSCPLIEDLRLIHCRGLKILQVSNLLKLNRVDLHLCHGLETVELQAPNLQTFWYHGKQYRPCKINLAACKSLESLTLEDPDMKDDSFANLFSNFPVLEKLVLSKCYALKHITISSYQLKALVLRDCKCLMEADIDTPNLLSFEYKGDDMPFSSLNPSGLKEANLYFKPKLQNNLRFCTEDDDTIWFTKLRKFLGKFDYYKGLKLVARSKKNVIIHEDLREILIPPLYNLKLEIIKSSTNFDGLFDNLLRTWHPKTLSVVSSSSSNFPKILYEKIMDREDDPGCCKYNKLKNKCWRHFLNDVEIENFEASDDERTSEWIAWLKSSPTMLNQTTSFRLNWKSHTPDRAE